MKTVSAIICAYNEEKTIENVVSSVSQAQIITEIVVVNDGSDDKTKEIIESLKNKIPLKAIHLPENKGKGYAMATGIENSTGEIIVFIDTDLSNLKEEHFEQLIAPVCSKEADMVLGQPTETAIHFKLNPFKIFTGQRALRRMDILPVLDKMKKSRFGVETLINIYYKSGKKKVILVHLKGLKHPTKYQKTTFLKATKQFVFETKEIIYTLLINYQILTHFFKI
jgi:glycosyltransferase involved in cell wall biosynthesis